MIKRVSAVSDTPAVVAWGAFSEVWDAPTLLLENIGSSTVFVAYSEAELTFDDDLTLAALPVRPGERVTLPRRDSRPEFHVWACCQRGESGQLAYYHPGLPAL
ncbi:hypothetical protein MSM1_17560 [Mycobacterium sp. SM1]|uniref:hypothetical protein n=1 Tax=Mycobacterium sp. SM1 TaxID=2816243 RepID=UPI001BCB1E25|nr:hypothetical protein [Mycobacterium sp. SM1]MBS4730067.1 hypothetical protein [Mycobacterium sp. SM1]